MADTSFWALEAVQPRVVTVYQQTADGLTRSQNQVGATSQTYRPASERQCQSPSGSANTNRLLPALGRSSGVKGRRAEVVTAVPVLTATY